VKGLIELHGGKANAYSEGPGRGSCISISLPVLDESELPIEANSIKNTDKSPHIVNKRKRVLVVEDNKDTADSLREVLVLLGHDVDVAYDGHIGISKAKSSKPEVIICDLGLPGVDGYTVAQVIRAEPSLAPNLLVALSGYALPEDRSRSRSAGFDVHLAKPIDANVIEHLLA
jgi:two-component system CheB/CheR fusion protein